MPRPTVTYRDVGLRLCAVDSELQWCVPVEERKEALGPEGGNEIFMLEPPVEAEHSVEVQGQTAAVVHQHTQLLSLEDKQKQIRTWIRCGGSQHLCHLCSYPERHHQPFLKS